MYAGLSGVDRKSANIAYGVCDVKALVKAFFGGGSTVFYVVLFAIIGGVYLKYDMTMKANKRLKNEIEEVKAASLAKDGTIASQARQGERKSQAREDLNNAEQAIIQAQDSNQCANSEPIRIALEQLLNKQSRKQANNPN